MRKYYYYTVLFFSFMVSYSQNFQGVAYYESKTAANFDFDRGRDIPEDMKKQMEERMKRMLEKTFILTFNASEANYVEEEKLETPGQEGGRRMFGFMGDSKFYKNILENRYVNQREVFGKVFLIKDTLPKLTWKLESETKKIGNYTCYKASAVKSVDKLDFRSMRPPRRPDNSKDADTTKTSLLDEVTMPEEITIVAWYTPEIPVNMGPDEYNGLPGLILEVNADRTTILCSKIILNPSHKEDIKEPTKGKEVSQQEFNEILTAKMKEMEANFRNGGGRRDGGGRPGRF